MFACVCHAFWQMLSMRPMPTRPGVCLCLCVFMFERERQRDGVMCVCVCGDEIACYSFADCWNRILSCLSVCLYVCLSVCLLVYMNVCLSSACLSLFLSIRLCICLSICLPALSTCLPVWLPVYLFVCPLVCLCFACLFVLDRMVVKQMGNMRVLVHPHTHTLPRTHTSTDASSTHSIHLFFVVVSSSPLLSVWHSQTRHTHQASIYSTTLTTSTLLAHAHTGAAAGACGLEAQVHRRGKGMILIVLLLIFILPWVESTPNYYRVLVQIVCWHRFLLHFARSLISVRIVFFVC